MTLTLKDVTFINANIQQDSIIKEDTRLLLNSGVLTLTVRVNNVEQCVQAVQQFQKECKEGINNE